MRSTLGRVLHFGSAHDGTTHFWRQRLTAAANVPLVIGFVILVVCLVGRPRAEVAAVIGSPPVAVLFLLLIVSVATHMRIGMQTIIEDYVHGEALKVVALALNSFYAVTVGAIAAFAVLKLAFGG